jgi:hypothetical protein
VEFPVERSLIDIKEVYVERGLIAIKRYGHRDLNGYECGWVAKFANPQSMVYALCYAVGKLQLACKGEDA